MNIGNRIPNRNAPSRIGSAYACTTRREISQYGICISWRYPCMINAWLKLARCSFFGFYIFFFIFFSFLSYQIDTDSLPKRIIDCFLVIVFLDFYLIFHMSGVLGNSSNMKNPLRKVRKCKIFPQVLMFFRQTFDGYSINIEICSRIFN